MRGSSHELDQPIDRARARGGSKEKRKTPARPAHVFGSWDEDDEDGVSDSRSLLVFSISPSLDSLRSGVLDVVLVMSRLGQDFLGTSRQMCSRVPK